MGRARTRSATRRCCEGLAARHGSPSAGTGLISYPDRGLKYTLGYVTSAQFEQQTATRWADVSVLVGQHHSNATSEARVVGVDQLGIADPTDPFLRRVAPLSETAVRTQSGRRPSSGKPRREAHPNIWPSSQPFVTKRDEPTVGQLLEYLEYESKASPRCDMGHNVDSRKAAGVGGCPLVNAPEKRADFVGINNSRKTVLVRGPQGTRQVHRGSRSARLVYRAKRNTWLHRT